MVLDAISEGWEGISLGPDGENDTELQDNAWRSFDPDGDGEAGFGEVTYGPSGTGDIEIYFVSLPYPILGIVEYVDVDPATKEINKVRIYLDNDGDPPLNDEDYKNLAAHELGHAIGLGHSGPPGTLMFALLLPGDAYFPLSKASLNALDRLYG